MSVVIARKWQSFSQKGRPRSVSLIVSWMWAMPLTSTLMGFSTRQHCLLPVLGQPRRAFQPGVFRSKLLQNPFPVAVELGGRGAHVRIREGRHLDRAT